MPDLRKKLRENDRIFVLYEAFKRMKSPEFGKLIRAYYQNDFNGIVYMVEHPGTLMPQKTIYDISLYTDGKPHTGPMGFCAEMKFINWMLRLADKHNMLPRVTLGKASPYYEPELEKAGQTNVFEYYFGPVSDASYHEASEFKNVIRSQKKHITQYMNRGKTDYLLPEADIDAMAEMYRKYIHLNAKTNASIFGDIHRLFGDSKNVLGVHARGGDFKLGLVNHPHPVPPEEYAAKAREIFTNGGYDKIFLATDDEDILKLFVGEFGDDLLYYDDVPRIAGDTAVFLAPSDRPLHYYRMGLEVLRDVYTLASCRSFLCGLSNMSFMVRYVKKALGEEFETLTVLNNGIN